VGYRTWDIQLTPFTLTSVHICICFSVYHASNAAEKLKKHQGKARMQHMCEYMLLVDKVKEPPEMFELWNSATAVDFADFSPVLLEEGVIGWLEVLARWEKREGAACTAGLVSNNTYGLFPDICMHGAVTGGDRKRRLIDEAKAGKEVLQRLHRRIHRRLYGPAAAGGVPLPQVPQGAEAWEDAALYRLFYDRSSVLVGR